MSELVSLEDRKETQNVTGATIGKLLRRQGSERTTAPFIHLPESDLTVSFADAADLVNSLAACLKDNGLRKGDRVAVILPNGLDAAIALLAVMSSGGIAVPLNPRLTHEELEQALCLSTACYVLSAESLRTHVEGAFEGLWRTTEENGHDPRLRIELFVRLDIDREFRKIIAVEEAVAGDPALILFTSGTTGKPKGVVLSHANLLTNAAFVRRAHNFTPEDRALCILPLFHINGLVITLLTPLLTGMAVVLPQRFSADHFWAWVRDYRVTWFSAVPTILSILISYPDPDKNDLASLRFARSASAPLPVAVLEEFERRFAVPVIETYGISEAACQVTANPLPPLVRKPGSAGVPIGNDLAVVDEQGRHLPTGNIGEVVIRGDNVFGGYLDNPAADRESLQNGWFRTGDLGYLDNDGYLFLTGRKKELINRAGEKISPREVEEIIHRLPEVEAVGVVGVPHPLYGEEVSAFITLRPGMVLRGESVRDFCREHLAGFKIPREVFFIDEFPKGPSGKIQRRRLVEVYTRMKSALTTERHPE